MSDNDEISDKIIELIKKYDPDTFNDLIILAEKDINIPPDTIVQHIIELENKGRLRFKKLSEPIPMDFNTYLFSSQANWFWTILLISILTTILIFTIPENMFPYIYVRILIGSIFILLLPGYSFIKVLFPRKEIDVIERIAMSIGVSLTLVPLVGFLLNYTPWGIKLTPLIISLLALIIPLTILGLQREYNEKIIQQ